MLLSEDVDVRVTEEMVSRGFTLTGADVEKVRETIVARLPKSGAEPRQ